VCFLIVARDVDGRWLSAGRDLCPPWGAIKNWVKLVLLLPHFPPQKKSVPKRGNKKLEVVLAALKTWPKTHFPASLFPNSNY